MNMEQLMEWEPTGEAKMLGRNLPQSHSVHIKKKFVPDLASNWGRSDKKPASKGRSFGRAEGRAIAEAVSRWLPTTAARVRAQF
jgi:hypothetical protein